MELEERFFTLRKGIVRELTSNEKTVLSLQALVYNGDWIEMERDIEAGRLSLEHRKGLRYVALFRALEAEGVNYYYDNGQEDFLCVRN